VICLIDALKRGSCFIPYFMVCRRVGLYEEAAFSEVFPYRRWHERELATAAALTLQKVS